MLNDPELDKMIIYGLAGVCLVLLLAVVFLAVKRNTYYIDDEGREVPSPKKQAKMAARKAKKETAAEPEPEPVAEPVFAEPEPAAEPEEVILPAEEEEPVSVPAEPVYEEEEPLTVPEPIFEEPVADDIFLEPEPAAADTVVVPFMEEEPAAPAEEPLDLSASDSAPLRMIDLDDEDDYDEEPILTESEPKPVGVVVTVTVAGQSQTHEIDLLPCLIGRESTACDLVISEPAVSRRHARFYATDDGLFIEDVSEHNGTFVNGTKLPSLGSAQLKENDRISLGRAEISVNRILY